MRYYPSFVIPTLGAILLLAPAAAQERTESAPALPAFPGAEGFGAYTVGGRGGDVFLVTTLADYHEGQAPVDGSLRAAIEATGPRNVVFRVSGYIDLVRPLEIREPYLTIAGQTAPGDGITIRRFGVDIAAPQVIVRHLRIRPGDVAGIEQDALNIRAPDVIVDHCSVSWGTDETLSVIGEADNVTVQWCLISESLHRSVHSKGAHGYGSLLTATGDVSIHHTAYALHHSRNPRPKSLRIDFRNNLIYGYGGEAGYNYDDFTRMNYVGNYIHPLKHSDDPTCAFSLGGLNSSFYFADNHLAGSGPEVGGWDLVCFDDVDPAAAEATVREATPIPAAFVTTHSPHEARTLVLANAGATLPGRDPVDERVIDLISKGAGEIIDSQNDVGGWPPLRSASAPADADGDGLPDAWETAHGLNPHDPADQAADADGDGYTNLEEYLNGTDPLEPFAWASPPTFSPPSGTAFTDSVLTVRIQADEDGARVHYTLDGTEPDEMAPRYQAPLQVRAHTHVRAATFVDGTTTMPAFAEYTRLPWVEPALLDQATRPGLQVAFYQVDDWDEREGLTGLEPHRRSIRLGLDLSGEAGDRAQGVVAEGLLHIPADGVYGFLLIDTYRSALRIGGRMITRGRPPESPPEYAALRAGLHQFELRSLREDEQISPRLLWVPPEGELQPLPADVFLHVADSHAH